MIVSHMVTKFRRFGVQVDECIWIDGEPYFSNVAIGKFLGFKSPRISVNTIVERYPFIEEYSKVQKVIEVKTSDINLMSDANQHHESISGKNDPSKSHSTRSYTKRFFDLMGFFLIAQKSNTPIAMKYQILLARLGKMYLTGKLRELTPEQIELEQHLDPFTRLPKGYGIRTTEIKQYMLKTGCSRATAYRHARNLKQGNSPFDKKWGNFIKPVINEDLGLRIRELFFANPSMTSADIWKAIDKKPSYSTVKNYVNKLKKEKQAAEGK